MLNAENAVPQYLMSMILVNGSLITNGNTNTDFSMASEKIRVDP